MYFSQNISIRVILQDCVQKMLDLLNDAHFFRGTHAMARLWIIQVQYYWLNHKKIKSRPWINNIQTIKENKEPSRKDSIFVQEPGIAGGHLPVHAHF